MKRKSTHPTSPYVGNKAPVWPAPSSRRERIAAGNYHRPPTVPVTPTVKPFPRKLAKLLRRMADGDSLRPVAQGRYGLFRLIRGAWRLLLKVKRHHFDRLEQMGLIAYRIGWTLTDLGRAAIGLKPAIDTSPLVKAAQRKAGV